MMKIRSTYHSCRVLGHNPAEDGRRCVGNCQYRPLHCLAVWQLLGGAESDYEDVFTAAEQSEFLFRLFRHLALGGRWCQYEDNVQPYLDVTKLIYKELVR